MRVQWSEVDGKSRYGHINLPTLPVEGQFIWVDKGDPTTVFKVVTSTWIVDGDLVEGSIQVSAS